MHKPLLLILDTDKIQDFIFGTTKLREMRGASTLLDELNRIGMPQIITRRCGRHNLRNKSGSDFEIDETIPPTQLPQLDCWVVSFGGGSARILFPPEKAGLAADILAEIETLYAQHTGYGATITGVVVAQNDAETLSAFTNRAEAALRMRKLNRSFCQQAFSSPYFKTCDSSGKAPATQRASSQVTGDDRLISLATYKKLGTTTSDYFLKFARHVRDHALSNNLAQNYLDAAPKNRDQFLPESLTDIGELSVPRGYIGLIYADGNRMGLRLQRDFPNFEDIAKFSEKMKRATDHALFQTLQETLDFSGGKFPFEIFLIGGDDILLAVPAQHAMHVAKNFVRLFNQQTQYNNTRQGTRTHVSVGVGVALAHANHPIRQLIELAEGLAKMSKSESQKDFENSNFTLEANYINFLVNKGDQVREAGKVFEEDMEYLDLVHAATPQIKLYKRPYNEQQLEELLCTVANLKKEGMPRTKLAQLYRALYAGWANGTLESLLVASRLPEKIRRMLLGYFTNNKQNFPWELTASGNYATPLLDWIELYDFIPTPNPAAKQPHSPTTI
jgi:hypothetical protein